MKVLIATYPYTGHVLPAQSVAQALSSRGHAVIWLTGPAFRAAVESSGAVFRPMSADHVVPDALLQGPESSSSSSSKSILPDTGAVVQYLRRLFLDRIPAQVRDYDAVRFDPPPEPAQSDGATQPRSSAAAMAGSEAAASRGWDGGRPDVLLVDFGAHAAACFRELRGVPFATLGINPLVTPDPEVPVWGSGSQPPRSFLGRWGNSLVQWLGDVVLYGKLDAALAEQRAKLGLTTDEARGKGLFYRHFRSDALHIMATTEAFEFPRRNMPAEVRWVGPLLPPVDEAAWVPPAWWDELLAHPRSKVVHVTQGTLNKAGLGVTGGDDEKEDHERGRTAVRRADGGGHASPDPPTTTSARDDDDGVSSLIRPLLRALSHHSDLLVIVTGAAVLAPTRLLGSSQTIAAPPLPRNARHAGFVPHSLLLPHVGVMVTNGGYGGVLAALAAGTPLVVAGKREDKADVASRVRWSGAGVDLRSEAPGEARLEKAVGEVLASWGDEATKGGKEGYRAAAKRIMADFATHDGPREAAEWLEWLGNGAGTGRGGDAVKEEANSGPKKEAVV